MCREHVSVQVSPTSTWCADLVWVHAELGITRARFHGIIELVGGANLMNFSRIAEVYDGVLAAGLHVELSFMPVPED